MYDPLGQAFVLGFIKRFGEPLIFISRFGERPDPSLVYNSIKDNNKLAKLIVTIPKSRHQAPRCARKRRDKKYRKDRSPTMFSLSEGCGCVSFRGGRRARSQGDDSSSCRSSEIEQEVPKTFSRRLLNGKCTMKSLAPLLKFWKRDDVSMTKAERNGLPVLPERLAADSCDDAPVRRQTQTL
ncbi:Serine/threonine-protein phosphatase [Operophtera brumata]|uniref:Serine/threonine-protein phosphatase n=1 Tax=Operophtera brumata TaxID=104452 RepID=A0A0L7KS63_OPEBR|nr:Serine/threonine-protein phosphatase [Operophtera brumata]